MGPYQGEQALRFRGAALGSQRQSLRRDMTPGKSYFREVCLAGVSRIHQCREEHEGSSLAYIGHLLIKWRLRL